MVLPRGILGHPPQSTPALLISKAALVSAPTATVTASLTPLISVFLSSP